MLFCLNVIVFFQLNYSFAVMHHEALDERETIEQILSH